jgi:hypothetical protein
LTLVDLLFLLAPVVVVPLGLRLVPLTGRYAIRLMRVARFAQPLGALGAVASFLVPVGWSSGLLAAVWLAACGLAGLAGLAELLEARSIHPSHLLPAAALGFLTFGAAWLVVYRSGVDLGFAPTVAELTAVHFHYAGFAATTMSALTLRALRGSATRPERVAQVAGLLVVLGTPITAAGFATGVQILTVIGPILLASGVLATAALTAFVVAPRMRSKAARWLLTISAAGVVLPMLLGVDYAASRVFPLPALDMRGMALIHGDLNALVFVLIGFVGWMLA